MERNRDNQNWKVDLHVHCSEDEDAPENTPQILTRIYRYLLDRGEVNALCILKHDGFPVQTWKELKKNFPDIPVMIASEVSARLTLDRNNPRSWPKLPVTHIGVVFSDPTEDWPFNRINWPQTIRGKLQTMGKLPRVEEVLEVAHE